jgi:protein-S-isoprenylcysteine O-methyltransferase Ste14
VNGLPSLGPRGEGWVAIQAVVLVLLAVAGFVGPAWAGPARAASTAVGLGLMAGGGVLAVGGLRDLGGALTPLPHPREGARLVETGIYARVRHPIYGGIILGGVGWGLVTASPLALLIAVVVCVFYLLKSVREEAWLVTRFPEYPSYRERTRRFIPWIG